MNVLELRKAVHVAVSACYTKMITHGVERAEHPICKGYAVLALLSKTRDIEYYLDKIEGGHFKSYPDTNRLGGWKSVKIADDFIFNIMCGELGITGKG